MEKHEYGYLLAVELPRLRELLNEAALVGWRLVNFIHIADNSPDGGYYEAIIERSTPRP